ncbi:MAG TPA: ATP-binding protein [Crocinitomicaceae bacterium]|nr:ATP-binding protein [Crocinitomicaceae bacterium]
MLDVFDLIITDKEEVLLNDVFLVDESKAQIENLLKEHRYIEELSKYKLPVNNKIILSGATGCGKTMTAKAIAKALGKNILILNLSNIISSRIGESSQHIKQVFDKAVRERAVLFLDEFDQIGKARSANEQDVGEMRRLVNSMIQLMDYFPEKALLIAATNHVDIIDTALLRRFQLRINFEMPTNIVLDNFYDKILGNYPENLRNINRIYGISFAEAKDYTLTTVKKKLIEELENKTGLKI